MYTSVIQYLDAAAERFPDKSAFVDASDNLTFAILRQQARRAASAISDILPSGSAVIVYTRKKAWDLVSFLGAAYAGCYYIPIDADMPLQRVQMIVDQVDPRLIIRDEATQDKLPALRHSACVIADHDWCSRKTEEVRLTAIAQNICTSDLLYVLFTSGSTGIPKGVTISHGAAIDFAEWIAAEYMLDETTSLCNQAPFYFDASVPDLLIPLKCGATTYIPPKTYYTFPKKILQYIVDNRVNTLIWVPSALCNVVNCKALSLLTPKSVQLVIFCGEVMPCKQLNVWRKALPNALFVNMYGPTEATYACMYYNIKKNFLDDGVLPLGKPCGNTKILLLNEEQKPAAVGEIGEIAIGGLCLSHGYYRNAEQTRKAFIQNPINPLWNETIYLTGDLAIQDAHGEITYVGRKDSQIKRLGHRIELGEIEHAAGAVEGVSNTCCLFDAKSEDIILIYAGSSEPEHLAAQLSNRLPRYMHPTKLVHLISMPMNLNGKIDRVQLKQQYIPS